MIWNYINFKRVNRILKEKVDPDQQKKSTDHDPQSFQQSLRLNCNKFNNATKLPTKFGECCIFIYPYPINMFLSWKCNLLFKSVVYIQVHFRLDFVMEANTMNPDQTAAQMGAVWSRSMLFAI